MSSSETPGGNGSPPQALGGSETQKQKPCRLWMQAGHCRFGTNCKFRHEEKDKGIQQKNQTNNMNRGHPEPSKPVQTPSAPKKGAPGSSNKVMPLPTTIPVAATTSVSAASASTSTAHAKASLPAKQGNGKNKPQNGSNWQKKTVCREWKAGKCHWGTKCHFKHEDDVQSSQTGSGNSSNITGSNVDEVNAQGCGSDKMREAEQARREAEAELQRCIEQERLERAAAEERARQQQLEAQRRIERERLDRVAAEKRARQQEWEARRCIELARLQRVAAEEIARQQESELQRRIELARIQRVAAEERARQQELEARRRTERERLERAAAEERARQQELEARRRIERERLERIAAEERARQQELEARRRIERERLERIAAEERARQQAEQARLEEERRRKLANEAREAAKKRQQEQLAARRAREATVVEKYIASEYSLIECGAGLEIRNVITGFDLCRITIKNLPRDANLREIADIFTAQGVDSSNFFIFPFRPNGSKLEAIVLANADQGQMIAIGLEGVEFRNEVLRFEISDNANWNSGGSSTRNAPFLTLSWWGPSEIIVVTYFTMEEAQAQMKRVNSKIWKGRRLRVVMNDRPRGTVTEYSPSSIKIMGCPLGAGRDTEFYAFVESSMIRVLQSITYDRQNAFQHVQALLENCDGVQMDSYEVLKNGDQADGEVTVKVQFTDWEDAKKAHDALDRKRVGFKAPILRSWLPKPLQYTIKIPRQQFEAQKKQWDSLSEKRKESDAHVHTRVGDRGDVFIRVMGQDKKAAGPLKVRVESMVAGEKLESTTHWHPSFASPRGKAFLDRVYREKQVYVRNDFKTRSLKVYGETTKIEEARNMINEEVERLAQMETTRVLDRPALRFFMREGLGRLKELLGDENVFLNVATTPAKITIKGGAEAEHHLQRLMGESRDAGLSGERLLPGGDNETCPICTDETSNPEQLGCGHTYCSACLRHFLTSATEFPLVCIANDNTCKVPIALPFVIRFLPSQVFHEHIEAAFASYLDKHAHELKYCTTPDCTQIYRRRTDVNTLQCPSCFSTICPGCDEEAHEGMSCEQRRIQRNPALQERLNDELAEANGWKKCPQCNIMIEKTEGCNHMECKCGAHICWRCMGIFEENTIYVHMQEAHAGIYDAVPAGVDVGNDHPAAFVAGQRDELLRLEQERERERVEEANRRRIAAAWARAREQNNATPNVIAIRDDFFARPAARVDTTWQDYLARYTQEARAQEDNRLAGEARRLLEEHNRLVEEARLRRLREAHNRLEEEARVRRLREENNRLVEEAARRREAERGRGCVIM